MIFVSTVFVLGGMVLANSTDEQEIKVALGATEFVCTKGLEVKFVDVVEDSRCPEGVDCIWAGNARIRIEAIGGQKARTVFELDTNGPAPAVDFEGVRISLKTLDPYPKAENPTRREDYKAVLTIADVKE